MLDPKFFVYGTPEKPVIVDDTVVGRRPEDDADDAGFIAPEQAGSMVMLAGVIIAGMVLTFAAAIGWSVAHQLQGRIDRLQAELRALHTFASCDAPRRPGDATVITYRRTDTHVATRCQVITNPTEPERAFKP